MPYKHRRACPICGKPNLLNLSGHLRQVHGLWGEDQRRPWLKQASLLPPVYLPVEQYPVNLPPRSCPVIAIPVNNNNNNSPVSCLTDNNSPIHCLESQSHPEFAFQHPYSMIVVGPSQCGKTHFIHQLLTHKCITYPDKKPVRVCWYYNQWQPKYDEIQRDLRGKIRFVQGVPELEEDLSDIKTSRHTILVLDDLMAEAKDSPVVSKLFTQGRHRNASVILLLQNMFPKGKYNTDISRNATYKVLFRSPGDRKQIDIMAEQTFAKDRPRFMQAYNRETDRPYGYIVVDNHPRTASEQQVVGNVLGDCYTYPHITASRPQLSRESLPREFVEESSRKRQAPAVKMSEVKASKKRKTKPSQKKVPRVKRQVKSKKTRQRNQSPVKIRQPKKRSSRIFHSPENTDSEEDDMTSDVSEQEVDEGLPGESYYERLNRLAAPEEQQETDWDNPGDNHYGEQKPGFRYYHPSRGGGGRTVYDDDDDMSPEQKLLKHAFYNPHLYPRGGFRHRLGFEPLSHH